MQFIPLGNLVSDQEIRSYSSLLAYQNSNISIAHLPFDRTFPDSYPQYLTKDDLAQGYADWAKKYDIVSTEINIVLFFLLTNAIL